MQHQHQDLINKKNVLELVLRGLEKKEFWNDEDAAKAKSIQDSLKILEKELMDIELQDAIDTLKELNSQQMSLHPDIINIFNRAESGEATTEDFTRIKEIFTKMRELNAVEEEVINSLISKGYISNEMLELSNMIRGLAGIRLSDVEELIEILEESL